MNNINNNINRGQKIYRSVKFIGKSVKFLSTKGASKIALKTFSKANIATAATDAVLSLLDAFNSYLSYTKEKEKTKQIIIKLETEKTIIENLNKEIILFVEAESLKIENYKDLSNKIEKSLEPIRIILKAIKNYIKEEQKEILNLEKFESLNSKFLEALEEYYKLTETKI